MCQAYDLDILKKRKKLKVENLKFKKKLKVFANFDDILT